MKKVTANPVKTQREASLTVTSKIGTIEARPYSDKKLA